MDPPKGEEGFGRKTIEKYGKEGRGSQVKDPINPGIIKASYIARSNSQRIWKDPT